MRHMICHFTFPSPDVQGSFSLLGSQECLSNHSSAQGGMALQTQDVIGCHNSTTVSALLQRTGACSVDSQGLEQIAYNLTTQSS